MTPLHHDQIQSPLGRVTLTVSPRGLRHLSFDAAAAAPLCEGPRHHPDLATRVAAYFDGDLDALSDAPLDLHGTPFQQSVWRCVRAIPPGATRSYAEIARAVGRPRAARAVGAANGANPVALVVPCHRVIGSDGQLTGYAFGIERKRWLLDHERRIRG